MLCGAYGGRGGDDEFAVMKRFEVEKKKTGGGN